MPRFRFVFLASLAVMLLLATGCTEQAPPQVAPLARDERDEVKTYLDAVAALNHEARDQRNRIRWWVAEVPGVIWDDRGGGVRSKADDARNFAQDFNGWQQEAQAIQPVPAAAAEAHAAYLASFKASIDMMQAYRGILDASVAARRDGLAPPDRGPTEQTMAAARKNADQATARATDLLGTLLRQYDESTPAS
jgi:hypothetical protein